MFKKLEKHVCIQDSNTGDSLGTNPPRDKDTAKFVSKFAGEKRASG